MTKYGYGVTPQFLERLVHDVVSSRSPEKAHLLLKVEGRTLSASEREELRGVLLSEFVDSGLGADDEPTARGLLIEAAMRWLGHISLDTSKG